jgi:hypothetical protein
MIATKGPGHPEGYPDPSTPRRLPNYPYTSGMADEDTVLEEAMENLKEAGQRTMTTQSLMCSEGMTEGENRLGLLTRLSTALAMTEAAYLEARRRSYGTLIKEGVPDRESAVRFGHAAADADPYSGCAVNSRVKTSPSAPKVPRSRPSTCASTAPALPVQMLNEWRPSKDREKPGSAIPS